MRTVAIKLVAAGVMVFAGAATLSAAYAAQSAWDKVCYLTNATPDGLARCLAGLPPAEGGPTIKPR